jgi:Cu(I)/Ag(I) efflux system protein CusF
MKRLASLIVSTVLLAACNQAPSPVAPEPPVNAEAMNMPQEQPATRPDPASAPGTAASASGTVESVDVVAGKITIAHGPVAALKWPAMTMAFAATPEQLASVKPGQQVEFDFVAEGMKASLTSIRNH